MSVGMATLDRQRVGGGRPREFGFQDAEAVPLAAGAGLENVNHPTSVVAGGTIRVTGEIFLDMPLATSLVECRVVGELNGQEVIDNVGLLAGNDFGSGPRSKFFEMVFDAPPTAGQTVTLRLSAQHFDDLGWTTDNTYGPTNIEAVTSGQKTTENVLDAAPWAFGGGAVGAGVAAYTGMDVQRGAVGGALIGTGAKIANDQLDGPLLPDVDFPMTEVIALTALLGAGAIFLSTSGIGGFTSAAGNVAQTATDQLR